MTRHLRSNLWLLGLSLLLCSVLYPGALLLIGQTLFPQRANGSIILDKDGKAVGSRLIAQPFTRPEYFWPRPSAVSWNAAASGASNFGASNPQLRNRVAKEIERYPNHSRSPVPADLVMASGSGLDPNITLKGALYQLDRVAGAWAEKTKKAPAAVRKEIAALLEESADAPLGGLAGVKLINVLEMNLALRDRYSPSGK